MIFLPPCQSETEKQIEEKTDMLVLIGKIFNMALRFLICFWRVLFVCFTC